MCGIVGYVGNVNCSNILIDALKKLEYRGYDSVGIAVNDGTSTRLLKRAGRVMGIEKDANSLVGTVGIGHTRWATHGVPSDKNSHPHQYGKFTIVHNGIIENFLALKISLVNQGYVFKSETDTEVVACLLSKNYDGDLLSTVKRTTEMLSGSYALAILCEDFPDTVAVAKKDSPIIIGEKDGCFYIASDIPAIVSHTKSVYHLNDGEFAVLKLGSGVFYNVDLKVIDKKPTLVEIDDDVCETGIYDTFMLKEINEIPSAISDTATFLRQMKIPEGLDGKLKNASRVVFCGCGTAYNSSLVGKSIVEKYARVPVDTEIASEFRYKDPILDENTVFVAVSQSGETADTIASTKLAKEKGAYIIVITNVFYSSLSTLADFVLHLKAGSEIAVAATKSYNCQLVAFYYLAELIGKSKGYDLDFLGSMDAVANAIEEVISNAEQLHALANKYSFSTNVFFLGRGLDYAVALEGALKLKEITYMHCEGFASGELKHGPLALIEKGSLAFILMTQKDLIEKSINCVHEVHSRNATVVALSCYPDEVQDESINNYFIIPKVKDELMPIVTIVPLQLFSYYVSRGRGFNPDKPRNLAKSVTVE